MEKNEAVQLLARYSSFVTSDAIRIEYGDTLVAWLGCKCMRLQ